MTDLLDRSAADLDSETGVSKEKLVLAMLALMGGETHAVSERDLFLSCWHAFPNAMRWVDTSLPNPDTFTAALRRLDAAGYVKRLGKTLRDPRKRRRAPGKRQQLPDGPKSTRAVRAMLTPGALEKAGVGAEVLRSVQRLAIPREDYTERDPATLVVTCAALRSRADRQVDEGWLTETAFHTFPAVFAYSERPEWPDVERVRAAIRQARAAGLLDAGLQVTEAGHRLVGDPTYSLDAKLDPSSSFRAGTVRFAARIEDTEGYRCWIEHRTLALTKPDELYRMLRVPPTTDPQPLVDALTVRLRDLRRVDKANVADYLMKLAETYNQDVFTILGSQSGHTTGGRVTA